MFRIIAFLLTISCLSCTKDSKPSADLPLLVIADVKAQEGDGAGKMIFTIEVSGQNTGNISLKYSTFDGTAKAGIDYTAVSNGTLTFGANETQKTIEISLLGNDAPNGEKEFSLLFSDIQNAKVQKDRVIGVILDDDFPVPASGYTTPTSYAGYQLVWADEFKSATLSNDWTHEIGANGWGNNELQYYRPENTFMVENEYLVIEARKENFQNAAYTSSRIITKDKKIFKYGRIDIRAALPKGRGVWPALWMLGQSFSSVGWPACGEIDIMEVLGQEPSKLYGTAHWDNNGQHASYTGSTTLSTGDFNASFHVFSIIWDSQKIRWYLDDVKFHEIDTTPAALSEFQKDHFFIFNIAVGGNWPGNPDPSTTFPQRMIVDYVRVFQ